MDPPQPVGVFGVQVIGTIFFTILQRKVLTPNDFPNTDAVKERILRFEQHYNVMAEPFHWTFTRDKLNDLERRLNLAA